MAKTRSARGGRGKKKAAKSAKRPKPARKAKKPARKAAKRASAKRKPARKARKPARKVQRKPVRKPARKAAASAKATARPKAPASAKAATTARAPQQPVKKIPQLDRDRRRLADEDDIPSAPSTLGYEAGASAARSGRSEMRDDLSQHTETGPALTGGDVDANWEDAYAVGDEAPGGDNPTPDQDRVDDIGKSLGVQYDDNEELKGAEKIQDRDRHRWELDPASSDDYVDRRREED